MDTLQMMSNHLLLDTPVATQCSLSIFGSPWPHIVVKGSVFEWFQTQEECWLMSDRPIHTQSIQTTHKIIIDTSISPPLFNSWNIKRRTYNHAFTKRLVKCEVKLLMNTHPLFIPIIIQWYQTPMQYKHTQTYTPYYIFLQYITRLLFDVTYYPLYYEM